MIVNVDQLQILHNRFRAFLEALRQIWSINITNIRCFCDILTLSDHLFCKVDSSGLSCSEGLLAGTKCSAAVILTCHVWCNYCFQRTRPPFFWINEVYQRHPKLSILLQKFLIIILFYCAYCFNCLIITNNRHNCDNFMRASCWSWSGSHP